MLGELGQEPQAGRTGKPRYAVRESPAAVLPLIALALVIVLFGFWIPTWPVDFLELLRQSVLVLQHGAREVVQR